MFKLIATIYFLFNGDPLGEPVPVANRAAFTTIEDCVAYKDSEKGKLALEDLNTQITTKLLKGGMTYTVTTGCEKVVVKDDGSI